MLDSGGMKVRLNEKEIQSIAAARGFTNAKQLADAAGIHYKSMYTIWNGEAQLISMDVLGRLCSTLRVQPGVLFEQVADVEPLPGAGGAKTDSKPSRKRSAKAGK